MSDEVKGILLKTEYFPALEMLSNEQLGMVLRAIMADVTRKEIPDMDDMSSFAFKLVAPSIRSAISEYKKRVDILKDNGKYGRLGGRPRKADRDIENPQGFSESQEGLEKPCRDIENPQGFLKTHNVLKGNVLNNTPYIPHSSEPLSLFETSSASPAECVSSSGKKTASSRGSSGYSDDFEKFWAAYPRKTNKGAAWKAWQKLRKEKVLPDVDTLRECLSWRKIADDWERDGGKYIPHPATWLNAHGWEDDACKEPPDDPRNDPREDEAYQIAQSMGGWNPLPEEYQNQSAYWKRMVRINAALEEAGLGEFGTPKDLIEERLGGAA